MSEPTPEQLNGCVRMVNLLFAGEEIWEKLPGRTVTNETLGDFMAWGLRSQAPVLEASVADVMESAAQHFTEYQVRRFREWAEANGRNDLLVAPIVQMRDLG